MVRYKTLSPRQNRISQFALSTRTYSANSVPYYKQMQSYHRYFLQHSNCSVGYVGGKVTNILFYKFSKVL